MRCFRLFPALVALSIAGCAQAQQAVQPSTAGDAPRYGGAVNVRLQVDPFDWDVTYVGVSDPTDKGFGLAYNSLLGVKAGPDVKYTDLVLQPELAERWETSPDARTYTFHLRRGVQFAGIPPVTARDLTSADVKWSFEYYTRTGPFKDKKLPQAQLDYFFQGLEQIETPDPHTVRVRFKEPFAPFLNYASVDYAPVLPREIYEEDGNYQKQIVGTGPYQLDVKASQKGSRWIWKKNPTYWENGIPYIDEARWLVIGDDSASKAAFAAKQIDFTGALSGDVLDPQSIKDLRSAVPDAVMFPYVAPKPMQLYVNSRKPPLNDVRVRRAISRSVDRDEFIRVLGGGEWALSGALAGLFTQEEIKQVLRYDPAEARRLLSEAGFPNGVDLEFSYNNEESNMTPIELLQSQLKKGGINLVLQGLDKAASSTVRKTGDYMMTSTGGSNEVGDPANWVYAAFYPKSKQNYWGVDDPRLTEILDSQLREPDLSKRIQIIRQAVRYINGDMVWGQAIIHRSSGYVWHPYLNVHQPNFWRAGEQFPVERSWIAK